MLYYRLASSLIQAMLCSKDVGRHRFEQAPPLIYFGYPLGCFGYPLGYLGYHLCSKDGGRHRFEQALDIYIYIGRHRFEQALEAAALDEGAHRGGDGRQDLRRERERVEERGTER